MKYITHKFSRLFYLAALVTLGIQLSSCKKDLDLNPLTSIGSGDFWTNQTNVNLAVAAMYRGNILYISTDAEYNPTDWWSYNGLLFLEFATDNAYDRRGDNSVFNLLTNGGLNASNSNLTAYWGFSYARIARCNYFLDNINKAAITDASKKRVIAEARFIRATQYFYLSTYFGAVPLVTTTLSLQQANNVTKSSQQAVQDFASAEFNAAIPDLPSYAALATTDRGRATQQAASAFLGRLYLTEKKWDSASIVYNNIITKNENIIDPDYAGLFLGTNEGSKEIIFATQYLMNTASNAMDIHFSPRMAGGFSIFCPLGSMAESYDFNDGTPFSYTDPRYNANNLAAGRDPRFAYNILYNFAPFRGSQYLSNPDSSSTSTTVLDVTTTTLQATRTGYCIKKYVSETIPTSALANSGIDLPLIRYAEVLLSYLEAQIQGGKAINQTLLDATINKVRGRASVSMPKITETDPTKLMVILKKERRNELAFEGIRLWDLYRWGDVNTVMQGIFYGAPFPGAKKLNGSTDPYFRWKVTTKAYKASTLPNAGAPWPIPQSEININPKLGL